MHGKYPDLPDTILLSQEVDIIAKNNVEKTEFLNVIGIDSIFHEENGYYADPVNFDTAILPKKWKNRLVNLKIDTDVAGAKVYCIEPHDLVVSKLAANREKDRVLIRSLLIKKLISELVVHRRIEETDVNNDKKEAMSRLFEQLIHQANQYK